MGLSRDSRKKKRLTGGTRFIHQKKRIFEQARPAANTNLAEKRIRRIRVRGGNYKFRALRLNTGNFVWASEACAFKTKILNVVYNASNNELVRTNTLVKNTIVRIESAPFRKFILNHYYGTKDEKAELKLNWEKSEGAIDKKADKFLQRRLKTTIPQNIADQIAKGQLLACISSRPGQSGRADGYILEGDELDFYARKLEKK